MERLTWIGFGVFVAVSAAVGVRLLLLWRRTRGLPELFIATGVLGIGPCGFAFSVFSALLVERAPLASQALWGVALFAMNLGGVATALFTWTVFRRGRRWALGVVVASAALFAGTFLADGVLHGFVFPGDVHGTPGLLVSEWTRIGVLAWGAAEALRYYAVMRRRDALGMGDPVVRNRLLLWGVGIGAAAWGSLVGTVVPLVAGVPALDMPAVQLSSSLHGLAAAVAMWLAFLPPRRYLRWVERGAARPA